MNRKLMLVVLGLTLFCGIAHAEETTSGRKADVRDYWMDRAIAEIKTQYGDTVSIEQKNKSLVKFGRCATVANAEPGTTIMTQIDAEDFENYLTENGVNKVSSGSSADTSLITIEGHTISGTDLTFVTQNLTLTGQTAATLTTPLARATRAYAADATDLTGPIYVYEGTSTLTSGKPDFDNDVHLMIPAGENQSEKASTSVSSTDYWIITSVHADVLEKTAAFADIELQIRLPGKVFREVLTFSASTSHQGSVYLHPYIIVPKNSDVRLVAVGSADNLDVAGQIVGILAKVIS